MSICEVKGCDRKHLAKGYCGSHYWKGRYKLECQKENYSSIPTFNPRLKDGQRGRIYTNGVTEEIKPLIPKIKNDVLNRCIANPREFLDDEPIKITQRKKRAKVNLV